MRHIFTVTAGRSGQASLTDLLNRHVPGCRAVHEGPSFTPRLPGFLGDVERRFRRRFIETHELLGRGRVLGAFHDGDEEYLDAIVAKRLRSIDGFNCEIYADVSKYFARGLHRAFARAVDDLTLILLVRDPLLNMRSFLNRDKDFYLDNGAPDGPRNALRLDIADLAKGELYLWAWCEMYLRYHALIKEFGVDRAVEIRTDDLTDAGRIAGHFDALGLPHDQLEIRPPMNTNVSQGKGRTTVTAEDIATFERFIRRLPDQALDRIAYFHDYDPAARHAPARQPSFAK